MSRLRAILSAASILATSHWGSSSLAAENPSPEAQFEAIKKTATDQELYEFLWEMPKGADLHNHLQGGGSVATDWLGVATDPAIAGKKRFFTRVGMSAGDVPFLLHFRTLQESNYAKLPPALRADFKPLDQLSDSERREWEASVILEKQAGGRKLFFDDTYFLRLGDLTRDANITAEMVVRAMAQASAEHVCYIEGMVNPNFMIDEKGDPVPVPRVIELFRERLGRPDAVATGLPIRFIYSVLRFSDRAEQGIEDAYDAVTTYPDLYVGLNILGSEQDDRGAPLRFVNVFRRMQRTHPGVGITLHAGEGVQTNDNRHVMESLVLGATRIGHGVNLISDPDTLVLMRTGKFLVEICLISDELVEYTPDLSEHPFPVYLRLGIPVCLNTDDRGIWDSNMTDEYYVATRRFNLSWDEMLQMAQDSIRFSFLPESEKARLLEAYAAGIRAFTARNMGGNWREALREVHPSVSGYARKRLSVGEN